MLSPESASLPRMGPRELDVLRVMGQLPLAAIEEIITLGRFPDMSLADARREAAAVLARIWAGEDVAPASKVKAPVFRDFAARMGRDRFDEVLAGYKEVGELNRETLPAYMDWDKTIKYVLERGEGECMV